MKRQEQVILGVNHQFLDLQVCQNAAWHRSTLEHLAADERIDALDFWITAAEPYRTQEIQMLRRCGKYLNYNIGDRYGEKTSCFAAVDPEERRYTREMFKRESDQALAVGARKIIMGSGPDYPGDRPAAKAALAEFYQEVCAWLPKDILLTLEPTDRDIDKRFLFGPLSETVAFVSQLRVAGCSQLAVLLDMGHIPLLYETIGSAVVKAAPCLGHIHLGNCVISNPAHPLYGDKHVPWGVEQGEYDAGDVTVLLKKLFEVGYFCQDARQTVSFEMRPPAGMTPETVLDHWIHIFDQAWIESER